MKLYRIVIGFAALSSGVAHAQKDKVLGVKAWQGTLTSGVTWEGRLSATTTVKVRESVSGTFVLDQFDPGLIYWTGFWKSGSIQHWQEVVNIAGGCTTTQTMESFGPIVPDTFRDFKLAVSEFRPQWRLHYTAHVAMRFTKRSECGATTSVETYTRNTWTVGNVDWDQHDKWLDLPASGTTLGFSGTGDFECNNCIATFRAPGWTIRASLTPLATSDLELEIDSAQYKEWRPSTTLDASDGEPIEFTATLKLKDGSKPNQTAERFEWELIETSKEPGVAMNWPLENPQTDFDLHLDREVIKTSSLVRAPADDTAQKVTSYMGPNGSLSDKLRVFPRDWGGWSVLRVTAYLTGGTKLVGKYKGEKEEDVRLPDRDKGDLVAKSWRKAKGVSGKDDSDEENDPVGDGTKGDGLTLYEEYRGFIENQSHIEGDPRKKDFFIRTVDPGVTLAGIKKFERISSLAVHHKFLVQEFPGSRVINFNHKAAPHAVDQHGVVANVDLEASGYAEADGGPGNPKMIQSVNIMGNWYELDPSYLASIVAHEFLHCVNVYHHGEKDDGVRWRVNGQDELVEVLVGAAYEGTPIRVHTEQGRDNTEFWKDIIKATPAAVPVGSASLRLVRGADQGQHSGADSCVMRYNTSQSYVGRAAKDVRYRVSEVMGASLCRTSQGTGVNDVGRAPQSRYGAASNSRGDCSHQILVNDAVTAPKR